MNAHRVLLAALALALPSLREMCHAETPLHPLPTMVLIPSGTFIMGSPETEAERNDGEEQHRVTLSDFYMDKYLVTQRDYLALIGKNPSRFNTGSEKTASDPLLPVEQVSWQDAVDYCNKITEREYLKGNISANVSYRLPTESEWEYACRAGTTTAFYFGRAIRGGMANFFTQYEYDSVDGTSYILKPKVPWIGATTRVNQYLPNAFGLFDMHGNLWQWCADWYGDYLLRPTMDPQGPDTGEAKVIRGGSWGMYGYACRSALRATNYYPPMGGNSSIGFRMVLAPKVKVWKQNLLKQSKPLVSDDPLRYPPKTTDKDSLVVITHGWSPREADILTAPDVPWVRDLATRISTYLTDDTHASWQSFGYMWIDGAWTFFPDTALIHAKQEGAALGERIAQQKWKRVHLIGHSAGSGLIQAALEKIRLLAPNTVVHLTFLDAFVGADLEGAHTYGKGAAWADHYFSQDIRTGGGVYPLTQSPLDYAYNVDITQLDPNKHPVAGFVSTTRGIQETCYRTVSSHGWPVEFYARTIPPNSIDGDEGFGIRRSQESSGIDESSVWTNILKTYQPNSSQTKSLGNPDPICEQKLFVPIPATALPPVNFIDTAIEQSGTGRIEITPKGFRLLTGSPAWLSALIEPTTTVNQLSFDAAFAHTDGASGVFNMYWDDVIIGTLDERFIAAGSRKYSFGFPAAAHGGVHVLAFRLDPFSGVQSVITVTNVQLGMIGVATAPSLKIVPSTRTVSKAGSVNTLQPESTYAFELTGQRGFVYSIQMSTNLIDWQNRALLFNTNGAVQFSDAADAATQRFYRAVVP